MRKYFVLLMVAVLTLVGCIPVKAVSISKILPQEVTPTETATPFLPDPASPTPSATALPTETPLPTLTPEPTWTSTPTTTPTWAFNERGKVTAPILLYHHVSDTGSSRYFVSPEVFEQQMLQLQAWGYTTVTVSKLADALIDGGDLPEKPLVITFDDGDLDVYQNAFPVMQRLGMVGTFYIVAERLSAPDFVSKEQLIEMVNAGWEIGNHSMSHADLTKNHAYVYYEMASSKIELEKALGIKIKSFAYPYGTIDGFVVSKVSEYGYRSAVGLGVIVLHTWDTLYYLNRIEVQRDYDIGTIAGYLPWSGPTMTPVP